MRVFVVVSRQYDDLAILAVADGLEAAMAEAEAHNPAACPPWAAPYDDDGRRTWEAQVSRSEDVLITEWEVTTL